MAHGKSSFKMPPLFRKEKDFYSIVNDPKKLQALKAVVDQAAKVNDNFKHFKTIFEWYAYVETILPDFEKKKEFTEKLEKLIYEYSNESKGSDTIELS